MGDYVYTFVPKDVDAVLERAGKIQQKNHKAMVVGRRENGFQMGYEDTFWAWVTKQSPNYVFTIHFDSDLDIVKKALNESLNRNAVSPVRGVLWDKLEEITK